MELRKYQDESYNGIRKSLMAGKKRPVLVLPTGGGKSPVGAAIIKAVLSRGKRALFLVHRRILVFQMRDTLQDHFGITPGIIMSKVSSDLSAPVQLASIPTLNRRLDLEDLMHNDFYVDADVVLIDECHRAVSTSSKGITDLYDDKIFIGFTATPCRGDGRGLGEVFDDLVIGPSVKELTDQGFLCPVRYYVPGSIDLKGVKIAMGDFQAKALAEKLIKKKLIGDIVENWLKLGENRKTLVFCVNVAHAIAVCDAFREAGINTEVLHARNSDDERDKVFEDMEAGRTKVICNVMLYTEGLDVPSISCISNARPTKSLGLFRQMGGRGLRVEEGKKDLIYLDHANSIDTHGLLDWDVEWTLDGKEKAWLKPTREQVKKLVRCRACGRTFEGSRICPDCGTEVRAFGKNIETIDGELVELTEKKKGKSITKNATIADKRRVMGMLIWMESKKKWDPGRKAHLYREIFSVWPNFSGVTPIEPEGAPANMIKYAIIKGAKKYQKAQRMAANGH